MCVNVLTVCVLPYMCHRDEKKVLDPVLEFLLL